MNEQERQQRNTERLQELNAGFRARLQGVLTALELHGLHPRIQDAWRSPQAQLDAWRHGFSKLRFGFHNVTDANGKPAALAADVLDNDAPITASSAYLLQLAAAAEQAGLHTGIRWGLPNEMAKAIDAAIARKDWHAKVKIGWDPTHVETTDITVAQAEAQTIAQAKARQHAGP